MSGEQRAERSGGRPAARPRVRLYDSVRSAHLERAAELPAATILYGHKRYDFDESLAASVDLVRARGWKAAAFLLRHPTQVLEINEPLMLSSARPTAIALLGLALGRVRGNARTQVVTYAIENLHPAGLPPPDRLRRRLARRLDLTLASCIWRRVDRVAYGTAQSRDLYEATMPLGRWAPLSTLIPALPRAQDDPALAAGKDPAQVVFVGAFVERKGFALLARAWPLVLQHVPGAQLCLVGKGALLPLAEATATLAGVSLQIDPPRVTIRQILGRSQILVLPSQQRPHWREQVGLPIVEGLSYGCTIVTTTQTGLAPWLSDHGHSVLPASASAAQLAEALVAALRQPLAAQDVLASLPTRDGRAAADAWLFDDAGQGGCPPEVALRAGRPEVAHG